MNRKKKRNEILKKRLKKAKAKLAPKSKSTYISKADRAKQMAEAQGSPDGASVAEESVSKPLLGSSPTDWELQR